MCVTYEDVIDYLNTCDGDELCASRDKVEENIEIALEYVEALTQTKFCPYEDCKVFQGQGNCYIYWGFHNTDALVSHTSILLDGEEFEFEVECHRIKNLSGLFGCKSKLEVCGLWGTPMPRNIKKAVVLLALEGSQVGITGIYNSAEGAEEITWADFKITYNDRIIDGDLSTGFRAIDRMILPFIPTMSQIGMTSIDNLCPNGCCNDKRCTCR